MNKVEFQIPDNCQIVFIDRDVLENNAIAIFRTSEAFGISVTIIPVEAESFSGQTYR